MNENSILSAGKKLVVVANFLIAILVFNLAFFVVLYFYPQAILAITPISIIINLICFIGVTANIYDSGKLMIQSEPNNPEL